MNRSTRLAAWVAATVLAAGGVTGCDADASADKKIDCTAINEEVTERLVRMANKIIWDNKLYKTDKPIPKRLLRDGKPIPFDDMTELQLDIHFGWSVRDNDAYEDSALRVLDKLQREAQATDFTKNC